MTRMHATQMAAPAVRLDDGIEVPQLGLTLFQVPPEETRDVIEQALDAGYRHFDTAAAHGNEREVGEAPAARGLPREDYFVTGKLANAQPDPRVDPRRLRGEPRTARPRPRRSLLAVNGSGLRGGAAARRLARARMDP